MNIDITILISVIGVLLSVAPWRVLLWVFAGLSLLCLISHRLYKKCLLSIANLLIEQTSPKNVECERVLLYGVGLRMRSYLAEIFGKQIQQTTESKFSGTGKAIYLGDSAYARKNGIRQETLKDE